VKRILVTAALLCCALGGCATVNHMAFDKESKSVDVGTKAVVLMTIDVSRSDDSRFNPDPYVVQIEKPGAQSKQDRQNFKLDKDEDTVAADGHTVYLARMALDPGDYRLMAVFGMARAFPINGSFSVPLVTDFNVKPGSITYVGRVTAKLRSREPGEFRAGSLIPLIDQAVAGMSNGTWDVTIEDDSGKDVPLFRQTFAAVSSATIVTSPLPPFDRAAAQRWWDDSSTSEKKTH
jgi:hypothetical protein